MTLSGLAVAPCVALAQEGGPASGTAPLAAAARQLEPLVIEEPHDRDAVEVPFTVVGLAPPGARLELWLDDELERAFRANSKGRFQAPVDRVAGSQTIWVHQVDRSGRRIQSAIVSVRHGSQKQRAAPMGRTDRPRRTATSMSGSRSEATEAVQVSTEEPSRSTSRRLRYLAASGAGLLGGLSGYMLGAFSVSLGVLIFNPADDAIQKKLIVGGLSGWYAGIPFGVLLTGSGLDGNGKWWAVGLGELAGLLAAGTAVFVVDDPGAVIVAGAVLLPTFTAALGYELSSDPSRTATEGVSGLRSTRPILLPTRRGTAVGLQLRF